MATEVPDRIWIGERSIDLHEQRVDGEVLSEQDCKLIRCLAQHDGEVVSKETLYREVWGYQRMPRGRALDFAIRRLRERLEADPAHPTELTTERGRGFRLQWRSATGPARVDSDAPSCIGDWVGSAERLEKLRQAIDHARGPVVVHGPPGVGKRRWIAEALRGARESHWLAANGGDWMATVAERWPLRTGAEPVGHPVPAPVLVVYGVADPAGLQAWLDGTGATPFHAVVFTAATRLGLAGEVHIPVQPLDHSASDALLLQRLEAMGVPAPDPTNRSALLDALDGIPKAIELAAPHLRLLSGSRLAERLTPSPGSWAVPASPLDLGDTLTAAVAALPQGAFEALALLSAFPQGLPLPQLEHLLGERTLDRLSVLGDRGLLAPQDPESDRLRVRGPYRTAPGLDARIATVGPWVHRTIAAFLNGFAEDPQRRVGQPAQAQLRAFLRDEHGQAEVWVALAQPAFEDPVTVSWVGAFRRVLDWMGLARRVDAFLEWTAQLELGGDAAAQLMRHRVAHLANTGRNEAASRACEILLAAADTPEAHIWSTWAQLDVARANLATEAAVRTVQPLEDAFEGDALNRGTLAVTRHDLMAMSTDPAAAAGQVEPLRRYAEAADDDELRVAAGIREAFHLYRTGDLMAAIAGYRRLLPLAQRLQAIDIEAGIHRRLALFLHDSGDDASARRSRQMALKLTDPDRHPSTYARLVAREAEYLDSRGEHDDARTMALRAVEIAKTHGNLAAQLTTLRLLLEQSLKRDPFPDDDHLDRFETLSVDAQERIHGVTVRFIRGVLAHREGSEAAARRHLTSALTLAGDIETLLEGASVLPQLAYLAARMRDRETANRCLERVQASFTGDTWGNRFQQNHWFNHANLLLKSP